VSVTDRDRERAGRESDYHRGRTAAEVAQEWVDGLVATMDGGGFGSGDVYDEATLRARRFMLAGGGPGCDITFVLDPQGRVEYAVLDYFEPDARALVTLTGRVAERLYEALEAAAG
jgi:hypothetical protein